MATPSYLAGIGSNFLRDIGIGGGTGAGFIILNVLSPSIAIGVPTALAFAGTLALAIFVAPIIEEIVFRGGLQGLLSWVSKSESITSKGFLVVAIITSLAFALFHYAVYGLGEVSAISATFIGAFIFGMASSYLTKASKSLVPSIIAHMIFNAWILHSYYLAVGVPIG
jgi:membrane protease YdiL (CAAX protease family)